jgi:crotonobetainyl-CoA:carnitine CoA-transferase CaiB-like acyl-CoA transferase
MAEMGADVIKVEPRGGDATRQNGPYFRDEPGDNQSLYWWAMNAGKRSITLELKLEAGRDMLRQLVEASDVVVETTKPGTSAGLGLDYRSLSRTNPSIIVTSITNFGQTGPYRNYEATDIVGSAMGGHMYLNGDAERGPVRTTVPQAYAQVNVQAAMGTAIALYARAVNGGVGQHVDVSMQEAMANAMDHAQQTWDIAGINIKGPGLGRNLAGIQRGRYLFESADGWVACLANGNMQGPRGGPIIEWLAENDAAGDLSSDNWRLKLATLEPLTPTETSYIEDTLAAFCRRFPKLWLVEEAQKRGAGWAPVLSPREIVESRHLAERDYWVAVRHEDIGETFIYPGAPFKMGASPWKQRGRAPHAGEHNSDVYGELIGMDDAGIRRARTKMAI